MGPTQAVVLGVIQGLTEFLPVSSSGHLVLAQYFLGIKEAPLVTDSFLHLGTLLAVIVFFWADLMATVRAPSKGSSDKAVGPRLIWLILVGSIPAAVIGFAFLDFFESAFSSVSTVGLMLLLTGGILWVGDWAGKRGDGKIELSGITYGMALGVGVAQAIAIMPGISRSGSTISSGLLGRMKPETAFRFSFFLAIPAFLGATILSLLKGASSALFPSAVTLAVGTLTAFLVGLAALKTLMAVVVDGRLRAFSYYCFALGTISLLAYYLL